jgi:Family of unknown function (DUF5343)
MAVNSESPGPYAPTSTIMDFIGRYRDRGLATPITTEVLLRAGVAESLAPRVMAALVTLELIAEDGRPTETLEQLRRAPEAEFKTRLAAWLAGVYADVFSFVNPDADEQDIRDAFRSYKPFGQQTRMVSLFIGLCRAADLRKDEPSAAARSTPRPATRKPASGSMQGASRMQIKSTGKLSNATPKGATPPQVPGLPAPLAGLLGKLPPEGGTWTQAERNKFEQAFKAMLDFSYEIGEQAVADGDAGESDD